jgi:thymidine phosphorylase
VVLKKVGDEVEAGEAIATLHAGASPLEAPEAVADRVRAAYQIGAARVPTEPLVRERIGPEDDVGALAGP